MLVQKIIQESINKNPLSIKEALEEELRSRVALALEAKVAESNDNDDEDCDDDEDDDMDESFDLSDYTLEELEDFMMSEDFEQLDEISKKTLASYVTKAARNAAENQSKHDSANQKYPNDAMRRKKIHMNNVNKRYTGISNATNKLAGFSKVNAKD